MNKIYSPLPQESLTISVDYSPVWEIALGIAGFTHSKMRHTFEQDEKWTEFQSAMSPLLLESLKELEETNLWYGLLMVQNKLSSSGIPDFQKAIQELEPQDFFEALLPYKNRTLEPLRMQTALNFNNPAAFQQFSSHFNGHEYLESYILSLGGKNQEEISELYITTLTEWAEWISKENDWPTWLRALSFESQQYTHIDFSNPIKEIERITGGAKFLPEPSVWHVKLIPHVSYRPWILEMRTSDTKLFFYPLNEERLLNPGTPPQELVRGHKALGDELRLKLLYQIMKKPLSLQDLSMIFNVSKTTLHHQLSLLKSAKFIRAEKGIYSADKSRIQSFSTRLNQFLESHD